jgi:toluene monooxygenase electron transfer component
VRTLRDCFFLDELSAYVESSSGRLHVTLAVSDEYVPYPRHPDYSALEVASGFVHSVAGQAMAERYDSMVAFVAGPPPMVDSALRMLIIEARLPATDIRYDKFG